MDDTQNTSDIIIFLEEQGEDRYEIRKERYNGELYYSVIDIIAALKVSQKPPRQYWAQLKEQVRDEGFVEAKSRVVPLHLKAADGRFRNTDCANQETLLRLFQIVSSENYMHLKKLRGGRKRRKRDLSHPPDFKATQPSLFNEDN